MYINDRPPLCGKCDILTYAADTAIFGHGKTAEEVAISQMLYWVSPMLFVIQCIKSRYYWHDCCDYFKRYSNCIIIQNINMLFTCIQKLQLPLSNIWVSIIFQKLCSPTGDPMSFQGSQAYTIIQQYEYFLIISLFILFGNCCIILILHSKVSFTNIIGTWGRLMDHYCVNNDTKTHPRVEYCLIWWRRHWLLDSFQYSMLQIHLVSHIFVYHRVDAPHQEETDWKM